MKYQYRDKAEAIWKKLPLNKLKNVGLSPFVKSDFILHLMAAVNYFYLLPQRNKSIKNKDWVKK